MAIGIYCCGAGASLDRVVGLAFILVEPQVEDSSLGESLGYGVRTRQHQVVRLMVGCSSSWHVARPQPVEEIGLERRRRKDPPEVQHAP